jgi:hypothetical protein
MALMHESAWRGKIYSGGWVGGEFGSRLDAPVIEPATGLTWMRSPIPAG